MIRGSTWSRVGRKDFWILRKLKIVERPRRIKGAYQDDAAVIIPTILAVIPIVF